MKILLVLMLALATAACGNAESQDLRDRFIQGSKSDPDLSGCIYDALLEQQGKDFIQNFLVLADKRKGKEDAPLTPEEIGVGIIIFGASMECSMPTGAARSQD